MKAKNGVIENLQARLKCKEEDLCDLHRQLDEANGRLEEELKCAKMRVSDTKQTAKKYKTERDLLCEKLKAVHERMRETKTAYSEVKDMLNNDMFEIKDKVSLIGKLADREDEVRKLREENRVKDGELCRLNRTVEELRRTNEHDLSKMKRQHRESQDFKCKIEMSGPI